MSPTDTCTFKITRKLISPDLQITIFDNLLSICIIMQFKGAVIASWLVYTFLFIMLITSPQMLQENCWANALSVFKTTIAIPFNLPQVCLSICCVIYTFL